MVPLSMILSNLWPGFQGHNIFEVEYRKNDVSYCFTLIGNYTWHMKWYYVWWPWLTSEHVVRVCQHQLCFLFLFQQLRKITPLVLWNYWATGRTSVITRFPLLEAFGVSYCDYHLYADDTQLIAKSTVCSVDVTCRRLESCVASVQRWCASRRLQLNADKTELIWFGSAVNLERLQTDPVGLTIAG